MAASTATGQSVQDPVRDRSIRLFTFLRELTELRTKAIRTLDQYEKVLWLHQIPQDSGCFCAAWTIGQDEESDTWVRIQRPRLPEAPAVSGVLEPWIVKQELNNPGQVPKLSPVIAEEMEDTETGESHTQYRKLADHPDVLRTWNEYLRAEWQPWADIDKKLRKILQVYTDLFSVYQRQQRLGEAYEVVLGLGYLSWSTPSGQSVRRHLVTAQTSLTFDAVRGIISVGPAGEGARPELEQDMLEANERPDVKEQSAIESQISELGDDIWEGTRLFAVLESWAHAVNPSGEFNRGLQPIEASTDRPKVAFAPALILRRRTERSLIRIFKEITEQLKAGADIPLGVKRLVTIVDDTGVNDDSSDDDRVSKFESKEIYFPEPANEEQLDIVRKLSNRQGLLVQGPPGTGKSHTIANLIAHLLALGQRVLVTSHTARALRVLKEKIAPEISELCVLVMGDDLSAMQSLEDSVRGINEQYDHWDEKANRESIAELEREVEKARSSEAHALARLRAIREVETYHHPNICGRYSGTAQQIARQLKQEESLWAWLNIQPNPNIEAPLTNEQALQLVTLLRILRAETAQSELATRNFPIDLIPLPQRFAELVHSERESALACTNLADLLEDPRHPVMTQLSPELRGRLSEELSAYMAEYQTANGAPQEWKHRVTNEILMGQVLPLQELLRITEETLRAISAKARRVAEYQIGGIEKRNLPLVKVHANNLLRHLLDGKSMGFGPFRPQIVKDGRYLTNEVVVDGQLCSTPDALTKLLSWIEVHEQLGKLARDWSKYSTVPDGSLAVQAASYEDLAKSLKALLHLAERVHVLKGLATETGIPEPKWRELAELVKLQNVVKAIEAESKWKLANAPLLHVEQSVYSETLFRDANAEVRSLLEAIRSRSVEEYARCCERLLESQRLRSQADACSELLKRLRIASEEFANTLESDFRNGAWDSRLRSFREAWDWARCKQWISQITDPNEATRLTSEVDAQRKRVRDRIRGIAAAKSWAHCFASDRLKEEQRQHLRAWATAVRRIGRGTGKHANLHRQAAREHMKYCRPAIPAWIMPIFRVAETVVPEPGAFDVVIVDEASQSGPEALFLQYIAKRMVVVGDDKQISPDFIGLNHDDVNLIRQRRVPDLPHVDALGVENSFFDIAAIRYSGRVRLREHFRCMPEIIQFSNNLCYRSEPLIPLRQYGLARLSPVVSTLHVSDGYQKGTSPRVTNPPEAEALVQEIVDCCADSDYKNKTFGVISLLGEDQARLIEKLLLEKLGPEQMEQRRLICGDAYAFQGDERDVIFLSMVSAPTEGHRIGTLNSPKDERRFNVAVSRARDQLFLVHTATLNDLSPRCLRYRLLEYCLNPHVETVEIEGLNIRDLRVRASAQDRSPESVPDPFDSWFEVDVLLDIVDRGFRVNPQVRIAGYSIDLVVEGMNGRLAVECDGDRWHGPDRYADDLARQRQLERCGWTFWRIRGSQYYSDPARSLEPLWSLLNAMGIEPDIPHEEPKAPASEVRSSPSVLLSVLQETRVPYEAAQKTSCDPPVPVKQSSDEDPGADGFSREVLLAVFEKHIPLSSKIEREVFLKIVATELGQEKVQRALRHEVNTLISTMVKARILNVDLNWDHIWRSRQLSFLEIPDMRES